MKIPVGPVSHWSVLEWLFYQNWAAELGVHFDDVQRGAGVKPASEGSRATKSRAAKGGAPRAKKLVYQQLVKLEAQAPSPTKTGELMMGVEEWFDIAKEMAIADAKGFLALLQTARQALADATKRPVRGALPKKKKARAIARAGVVAPELESRAGDETPAEIAMRKRKQS